MSQPYAAGALCSTVADMAASIARRFPDVPVTVIPNSSDVELFDVVDAVVPVPDALSIGAMRVLGEHFARSFGGSSGTTFAACLHLAAGMRVVAAELKNGLLSVVLDRPEPQKLVRKINISVKD